MNTQAITEESSKELIKEWREEARKQTLDTLPNFLHKLANTYSHDYGTICHAMAAAAAGAAWALNASPTGGITGFQSGAVMWEFIKQWNYSSNECGLRILDYDNILFPQYESTFAYQSLSPKIWDTIQKVAQRKLDEHAQAKVTYAEELAQWNTAIAEYIKKFPDYNERPDYYSRLGWGTGDEWEAERVKEESGFDFAPSKPYEPMASENVLRHWKRISMGLLPFDMTLSKD